jgi:hypothetical protein
MGAIIAIVVLSGAGAARMCAQPLIWNPPCPGMAVYNFTAVPITLNLVTNPPGAIPPITVNPCPGVSGPATAPSTILGVISQAGNFVPMGSPAPVAPTVACPMVGPPPTAAANGWVRGVTITGSPCVDIYFYTTNDPMYPCTVFVVPTLGPCVP